jgi:hypothetical protein
MVRFLAFVNVSLLVLLLSPYFLRRINKHIFKNKNKILKKYIPIFSKYHMYFGFILLITAFVHGYMALGAVRFHSGYILWLWVLIQVTLGIFTKKKKNPKIFKIHRLIGIGSLVFLIIHLIQVN